MKKLIVIRGSSGVGKSSVVKRLVKKMGKNVVYLPVAHITYSLLVKEPKFASNKLIDLMHDNADDLIRNFLKADYTVVTDAIFSHETKSKSRLKKLVRIGKNSHAKVYVFELSSDLPTLIDRAKKRKRPKDVKTNYNLIKKKHKNFLKTKYKNAININTEKKSINQIVVEIVSRIKKNETSN